MVVGVWPAGETSGERGYHWRGAIILLLTTTGRSSGEPRTTPLIHRVDGERWVVKHTGVRPEGTTASATNIMSRERPDLVRWVSTDRVIGDESLPVDEGYVLVRVPPSPRLGSGSQATSSPSPNNERSPR